MAINTELPIKTLLVDGQEIPIVAGSLKFAELVNGTITSVEAGDLADVTMIRDGAFEGITTITSAVIPSNVISVGESAFAGCSNLNTLVLEDGLQTIGADAFNGINASVIELPSTLISVGESAFANNTVLSEITIPSSLSVLPAGLFSGCTSLINVTMEATTPPSVTNTTFPSSASIYVKYGAYDDYVAQWSDYASQIVRLPAIPSTITITVNNYLGELVSGASVTISGNGQTYAGTTNSIGVFTQGDLQPATYTITVADIEGFKTPDASEVVVLENTQNSVMVTYLEKPVGETYGVRIDLNNSDPETSVEYTDDAVGFDKSYMDSTSDTFVYGSWADKFPFNQIKPCILKDGVVTTYLNPNNYAEDINGNAVDITATCDGDVMIEIPKVYYRLHKDDNYQYIQISSIEQDGFCCLAHTHKNIVRDKVYVSAYEAYYDTSARSVSGVSSSGNIGINNWRTYIQAKGEGYDMMYWNVLVLIQALYVIQFKNLNSQSALGYGAVSSGYFSPNGTHNARGMYYGSTTRQTTAMKYLGMENLYGNRNTYIDGCVSGWSTLKVFDTTNVNGKYNSSGSGYIEVTHGGSGIQNGSIKTISGTNETGFFAITAGASSIGASSTTYYCDTCGGYLSMLCLYGASAYSGESAGIFNTNFNASTSETNASYCTRITYHGQDLYKRRG